MLNELLNLKKSTWELIWFWNLTKYILNLSISPPLKVNKNSTSHCWSVSFKELRIGWANFFKKIRFDYLLNKFTNSPKLWMSGETKAVTAKSNALIVDKN